jgi:hypothetical protein
VRLHFHQCISSSSEGQTRLATKGSNIDNPNLAVILGVAGPRCLPNHRDSDANKANLSCFDVRLHFHQCISLSGL